VAEMNPSDPPPVRAVPNPLPSVVQIGSNTRLRFTPRELRMIREQTGQTLTDLMQDEPLTLSAWLSLRRNGYPDVRWDELDDVEMELVASEETRDPLPGPPSTTSPPSAGIGE